MEELIGKKITKVEVNGDSTVMVFTDANGDKIAYEALGDCCSYSWFSDITGLGNLVEHTVSEIVDREEFSEEEQKRAEKQGDYECLALYGHLIKTEKGTCDIEYRNDSNGYYGGWCQLTTTIPDDLREVFEDRL